MPGASTLGTASSSCLRRALEIAHKVRGSFAARCADNVEEMWRSAKGTAATAYRVVAVFPIVFDENRLNLPRIRA